MSLNDVLAELRRDYLKSIPEKIKNIETLFNAGEFKKVETEFHKLKGSGKTYGFPEVSLLGEVAEKLCRTPEIGLAVKTALKVFLAIHETHTANQPFHLEKNEDFCQLEGMLKKSA